MLAWLAACSQPAAAQEEEDKEEEFSFHKEVTQELLLLLHWIIYLMADLLHIAHVVEASQLLARRTPAAAGQRLFRATSLSRQGRQSSKKRKIYLKKKKLMFFS